MAHKLTVVIVSYNVKYYLEQCLVSLRRALTGIDAEVYVVDNDSKDDSIGYLAPRFPEVKMIASRHNLGLRAPTTSPSGRASRSMCCCSIPTPSSARSPSASPSPSWTPIRRREPRE